MAVIFVLSAQSGLRVSADDPVDFVLRKVAHVLVYAVLAFLLVRAIGTATPRVTMIAFAIAVLYAFSDELHQASVAQRSGNPLDLVLDAVGAWAGARLRRPSPAGRP